MDIKQKSKAIVKSSFVYRLLLYYRKAKANKKAASEKKSILKQWEESGRPVPAPHFYKIAVIQHYAAKFHTPVLIETGTYLGETLAACKHLFKNVISIELDQKLYENARHNFENDKHVTIYRGDSGEVLEKVLADITKPCLFWLDGHYSEGITAKGQLNTPIINEIRHIFKHPVKDHVLLIDDARCFVGKDDYPSIATLRAIVKDFDPSVQFTIKDDIIRIHRR